jgi:hypothetical protein
VRRRRRAPAQTHAIRAAAAMIWRRGQRSQSLSGCWAGHRSLAGTPPSPATSAWGGRVSPRDPCASPFRPRGLPNPLLPNPRPCTAPEGADCFPSIDCPNRSPVEKARDSGLDRAASAAGCGRTVGAGPAACERPLRAAHPTDSLPTDRDPPRTLPARTPPLLRYRPGAALRRRLRCPRERRAHVAERPRSRQIHACV